MQQAKKVLNPELLEFFIDHRGDSPTTEEKSRERTKKSFCFLVFSRACEIYLIFSSVEGVSPRWPIKNSK